MNTGWRNVTHFWNNGTRSMMRSFLTISNLRRAIVLGTIVSLMALPRIVQGGLPLGLFGLTAFCVMTLVAGAVTAWGSSAGMCGAFPDLKRQLWGVGIALLVASVALPVQVLWLDPVIHTVVTATGDKRLMNLTHPATVGGIVAAILWSAGFEALFFNSATVSFLARLSGKVSVGIIGSAALRLLVSLQHQAAAGISTHSLEFMVVPVAAAVLAGILFSRTGLIPVVVLGAGLKLHLFLVDQS